MIRRLLMVLPGLAAVTSHAGGHFDVDDAGTLDPGRCLYEVWGVRVPDRRATVFHVDSSCRVGPVELGLNFDRASIGGKRTDTLGPQVKWTFLGQAPDARLSAAVSVTANFDFPRQGRNGGQFVVPVTWRVSETLQMHANLGADWPTGDGARTGRRGLAAEWAMNDSISLIAERNRAFNLSSSRVGVRYNLSPLISIDASAAQIGPGAVRSFVIGWNQEFGRP